MSSTEPRHHHSSHLQPVIRAVFKRFNSLVPQADNLVVKVDRVISRFSTETGECSFLFHLLKSILQTLQDSPETSSNPAPKPELSDRNPSRIRQYQRA
uniref:Uncharacterized protein n=1 Tax=Nelumbo nucifera TaxID=4432 RepID=A0A822ZKX7_NELNU|nr:TPA_asm: hypothetical protein HUJ06_000638 [Nelumbo nucifera]